MCGIVAYLGPKSVDSVLLVGLTRLEYRGYDSAGIAVLDNGEITVRKEKGKIKDLEDLLLTHPVEGTIGIGHTRWATHGEPNRQNAHPHVDNHGKVAVVHNGIIENHHTIRQELIEKGHVFHSETDTEVIPHLFEDYYKKHKDSAKALQETIARLDGRYAFVVLVEQEPDRLYFARSGSPLVYGRGRGESFLASDVSAIVPAAKEHLHIDNDQWGWITKDSLELRSKTGEAVPFEMSRTQIDVKALDRAGYDHFMLKEIHEQPGIVRRIIQSRMDDEGIVRFPEMNLPNDFLNRVTRCMITSAGTSWHAGIVGKFYLEQFARLSTEVDISSEFRNRNPIADGETLVMAISQSGETADTLAGIHQAKAKFCRVLSFVNVTTSSIARESNAFIDLMAGPEIGVASTKAYTAQLMNLLFYALFTAGIKWLVSKEEREQILHEIRLLPEKMEQILARADEIKKWASELRDSKDFVFLGRSFNHPTALEGALKLKEIAYVHASGYAGGEFKHGPIALISDQMPVICIAPQCDLYEKMVSNIEEVRSRKGRIISIYTEGDTIVPSKSDYSFAIPQCADYLTPILTVLPLQLFAYYSALERGCEPDQPRNLAKSVTVE
ncbi:MAG TPA: glutamine--fructose-6-phosphate transaminase (isomerizing) [Leptospiraceae bacterium]|nr:glutamine--fructose-6-phosphate transaminase (isomerizing) [Leptospiraceae bacterium]